MAIQVVRYDAAPAPQWGVVFGDKVAPLTGYYPTTADFVVRGIYEAYSIVAESAYVQLESIRLLSPITYNQQIVCQGSNYQSLVRARRMQPTALAKQCFFPKAASSLTGPHSEIVCPPDVRLLDYAVSLGLIVGQALTHNVAIEGHQLHEYLVGLTIFNDLIARDVQWGPQQAYAARSFRTFGPAGPYLLLLDESEWSRLPELHIELAVNCDVRQNAYCREWLTPLHVFLSELAMVQNLYPGDLIATSTPAGGAFQPVRGAMRCIEPFLPRTIRRAQRVERQFKNPLYLNHRDVVTTTIRTDDGLLDLGIQQNLVIKY